MLNGLYSVRFHSSSGNQGSGVVAFIDSRAFGGDASYFYRGRWKSTEPMEVDTLMWLDTNLANLFLGR